PSAPRVAHDTDSGAAAIAASPEGRAMNDQTRHEVISAFIDNEPFDANELGTALATPEGRELLLDLISLRHVVIADGTSKSASRVVPARMPWRGLAAAAAIVLALGGGYLAGHRPASDPPATMP